MSILDDEKRLSRMDSSSSDPGAKLFALTLEDFALLFGASINDLPEECRRQIHQYDFRFKKLSGEERDQVLLDVLKKLDDGQFSLAGKNGKPRWEKGWAENFRNFMDSGRDLNQLVPMYIRRNQPLRLNQNYILPIDSDFELNWFELFQCWLFKTYFEKAEVVYEFGCGSGINLAKLAKLYPEKRYVGLDWASSSKKIVDEMAQAYGWNMEGHLFDFFEPDYTFKIEKGSIVFTLGALEQTGRDYQAFVEYLLRGEMEFCVNIEPIVEWYDESNVVDYAAIRFHKMRHYWEGFPILLKQMEREGRVEILKMKRSHFGSLFLEGYSQTIWKPTGRL